MRARARRALEALAGLASLWATLVHVTGGIVVPLGAITITSRNPRNAWLAAAIAGLLAVALTRPDTAARLRADGRWWSGRANTLLRALRARGTWIPAALIGVAAAVLLVHEWAQARPLWLDEQMIALNLRERGWTDLAGALWLGQAAPFGWLVVQRLALVTFGDGELALRLVPMLSALATVTVAWWVGRRWLGAVGATVLIVLCVTGEWLAYYALELKHYSTDVWFALWLPALGAWVMEAPTPRTEVRRHAVWWTVAAVGQWVAHGALLVTPGCATALALVTLKRLGWRAALRLSSLGLIWLASFGLHYLVAIRHTLGNAFLEGYWAFAMPPEGAGLTGTLAWLAAALEPLALKPGGSEWGLLFWLAAAAGMAAAVPRPLGLVMATVPLSAFLLASLRLVPLFERLSLWMVPALYAGIALLAATAVRRGASASPRGTGLSRAAAVAAALAVATLCVDVVARGRGEMVRTTASNHSLDDRTGLSWLLLQQQPGDVILTTHLALPAVWWYGRVPIGGPGGGGKLVDGSPILEVGYERPGPGCGDDGLGEALRGSRRALVYFGFRFDDVPRGFDRLLLERMGEIGTVRAVQTFTDVGRAVVFDIGAPMARGWDWPLNPGETGTAAAPLEGCLEVRVASRW